MAKETVSGDVLITRMRDRFQADDGAISADSLVTMYGLLFPDQEIQLIGDDKFKILKKI